MTLGMYRTIGYLEPKSCTNPVSGRKVNAFVEVQEAQDGDLICFRFKLAHRQKLTQVRKTPIFYQCGMVRRGKVTLKQIVRKYAPIELKNCLEI